MIVESEFNWFSIYLKLFVPFHYFQYLTLTYIDWTRWSIKHKKGTLVLEFSGDNNRYMYQPGVQFNVIYFLFSIQLCMWKDIKKFYWIKFCRLSLWYIKRIIKYPWKMFIYLYHSIMYLCHQIVTFKFLCYY